MERRQRNMIAGLALFVLAGIGGGSEAHAADCQELRTQVEGETSLLKKRDLLAGAVKQCPQDASLNFSYAKTLERLRKYDDALKYYKVATAYESTRAKAYFGMGDIYALLSNPERAVAAYEKGLAADPKNERAQNSLDELRKKYNIRAAAPVKAVPSPPPVAVVKEDPVPVAPAVTKERPIEGPDLVMQEPF